MSYMPAFLLRLIGQAPEQLEAEEKFRENLKKHEAETAALDDILGDLRKINAKAQKQIDLNKTLLPFDTKKDDTPTEAGAG